MREYRRLTIVILAFSLLANNSFAGTYGGGSGTAEYPYQIGTAEHLIALGQTTDDYYKHFFITADIDMGEHSFATAVIGHLGGKFDGNGHKIINLTIDTLADDDPSNDDNDNLGLFGSVSGEVFNISIENVVIRGGNNSRYIGGLCGSNIGTLFNCHTTGNISGNYEVGGLVGTNRFEYHHSDTGLGLGYRGYSDIGTIQNCYSTANVIGGDESFELGGLCGSNGGDIDNCSAIGRVIGGDLSQNLGGLCGFNGGDIDNCSATGKVIGGDYSQNLGGLCGSSEFIPLGDGKSSTNSCYARGGVTGGNSAENLGGLCGSNSGEIDNCYAKGNVSGEKNSHSLGGLCGKNHSLWQLVTYGKIVNSFSIGIVTGGADSEGLGGLVGTNYDVLCTEPCEKEPCCTYWAGEIINSYWDTQASGLTNMCGDWIEECDDSFGKTTAEMKQQSTFTDWDFINVWNIGENQTYPYLRTHSASDLNKDHIVNLIDLAILSQQWLQNK